MEFLTTSEAHSICGHTPSYSISQPPGDMSPVQVSAFAKCIRNKEMEEMLQVTCSTLSLFKDEKAKQAFTEHLYKPDAVLVLGPKGVNQRGAAPTYPYGVYKLSRIVRHTKLQNDETKA